MAGGGAMIHGIEKAVADATKMPVYIAEDPLTCVVRGCGKLLDDLSLLNKIRITKGI